MIGREAEEPGYALTLRHQQKWAKYGEACLSEGVRFCPLVIEAHGGWSTEASEILKLLASSLAKATGGDKGQVTRHLFGRLAILLQKGNATLLLNRTPVTIDPAVDGFL